MVIRELLSEVICALAGSGTENARFEAECMFRKAGIPRIKVITEPAEEISAETEKAVWAMLARRLSSVPPP